MTVASGSPTTGGEPTRLPTDLKVNGDPDVPVERIELKRGDKVVVVIGVGALVEESGGLSRPERYAIGEVVRATICKLQDARERASIMAEEAKRAPGTKTKNP